jgi:hypothetical protein
MLGVSPSPAPRGHPSPAGRGGREFLTRSTGSVSVGDCWLGWCVVGALGLILNQVQHDTLRHVRHCSVQAGLRMVPFDMLALISAGVAQGCVHRQGRRCLVRVCPRMMVWDGSNSCWRVGLGPSASLCFGRDEGVLGIVTWSAGSTLLRQAQHDSLRRGSGWRPSKRF